MFCAAGMLFFRIQIKINGNQRWSTCSKLYPNQFSINSSGKIVQLKRVISVTLTPLVGPEVMSRKLYSCVRVIRYLAYYNQYNHKKNFTNIMAVVTVFARTGIVTICETYVKTNNIANKHFLTTQTIGCNSFFSDRLSVITVPAKFKTNSPECLIQKTADK